jgi:hypothetical protein
MKNTDEIDRKEMMVLLNKNWMTHDGMWFFHCLQAFGIETANRLNLAAIESLAPLEIGRLKKILGFAAGDIESIAMLQTFFEQAAALVIPDFMGGTFRFTDDGSFHIEMKPGQCFAYKGMQRLGVIEDYRCGVIYRIECWMRALGVDYAIDPPTDLCRMHHQGSCHSVMTFRWNTIPDLIQANGFSSQIP